MTLEGIDMAPDSPQILLVTYQYQSGSVIFRTSPSALCPGWCDEPASPLR
jgi:hypothetical protein